MRIIICAVIASVAFIVGAASASAQDPAVVNAKTVKVKFENEKVRVLEAELPPGTKEAVHSHPAYVIYVMAGGKVRNYASDGKTTESELKTGDVLYRIAVRAEDKFQLIYCERLFCEVSQSATRDSASDNFTLIE